MWFKKNLRVHSKSWLVFLLVFSCHLEHAPFLFTFIALGSHSWSFIVPTFVFTARDSRSQRVVSLLHRACGQRPSFANVRVGQPHDRDQGLMFAKSSDLDRLSTFFGPKSYFSISEFLELGLRWLQRNFHDFFVGKFSNPYFIISYWFFLQKNFKYMILKVFWGFFLINC